MITSKWSVWKQVTPPASAVNPSYFVVSLTPCPMCCACFITGQLLWDAVSQGAPEGSGSHTGCCPYKRPAWLSSACLQPWPTLAEAIQAGTPAFSPFEPGVLHLRFTIWNSVFPLTTDVGTKPHSLSSPWDLFTREHQHSYNAITLTVHIWEHFTFTLLLNNSRY